ncbi:MAG: hypothetical protein WC510_04900 [Candidatus Omnitrophota bacterium]
MAIKKKKKAKKPVKKIIKKKKVLAKSSKRPAPKKKAAVKKSKDSVAGIITHYFPKVKAAVTKLKLPLAAGDLIRVKGHTTDFKQTVSSMQIDRTPIISAKKGQEIGLLVNFRVRRKDIIYKI